MSASTNLSNGQSHLSQGEFKSLLTTLANKPKEATIKDAGRSVELIGVIGRLWQTIKGWLGFNNQADPVKVNFKLMKLLCEGERQPYFQDTEIKSLIRGVQARLSDPAGDKRYADVAAVIQETLISENTPAGPKLIDRVFTYKRDHSKELAERGWPKLIHRFAPTPANIASLNFEQGQTAFREGRFADAIKCFESAVKIDPSHVDFVEMQLALSEACFMHSEQLVRTDDLLEVTELVEVRNLLENSLSAVARTKDALIDTPLSEKRASLTSNVVRKLIDIHLLLAMKVLSKDASAARISLESASNVIRLYRQVWDDPKDLATLWFTISGQYQQCNDTLKALEAAEEAIKIDELQEYSEAIAKLSDRLLSVDSVDACQELLNQRPNDWRLHVRLGYLQLEQNNVVGATLSFNTAKSLNPAGPEPLLALGRVSLLKQELEQALQFYEQVIATTPAPELTKLTENEILVVYKCIANRKVSERDYDAALETYQRAIRRLPMEVDSIVGDVIVFGESINIIYPLMALKAFKLALPHLADGNVSVEQSTQVYLALGREAIVLSHFEDAKGYLERVANMNSGNSSVLRQLSDLYIRANDLRKAEHILRGMTETGMAIAKDYCALATLSSRNEKYEDTLNFYRLAITHDAAKRHASEILEGLVKLADSFHRVNALESSFQCLETALAVVGEDTKRVDGIVKKLIELAVSLQDPQDPLAYRMYELAAGRFGQSTVEKTEKLRVLEHLAAEAERMDNVGKAAGFYVQYLEIDPNSDAMLENLIGLYRQSRDTASLERLLEQIKDPKQVVFGRLCSALADLYRLSGKSDQAMQLFLKGAGSYLFCQQYDKAEHLLDQVLDIDSDNVHAYAGFGMVAMCKKNYYNALGCYQTVKRLAPEFDCNKNIYQCIVSLPVEYQQKKWAHANTLALYETAFLNFKGDRIKITGTVKSLLEIAESMSVEEAVAANQLYALAAEHFDESDLEAEKKLEVLERLAEDSQGASEFAKAIKFYQQYLKVKPDALLDIIADVEECCRSVGDQKFAEECLVLARGLEPQNPKWMLQLAELYDLTGRGEESAQLKSALTAIHEKFVSDIQAGNEAFTTLMEEQPLDRIEVAQRVIQHYQEARRSAPHEYYAAYADHHDKLIEAYVQIGRPIEAIEAYTDFEKRMPGAKKPITPEVFVSAARQFAETGDLTQANTTLKRAVRYFPTDELLKQEQGRFGLLLGNEWLNAGNYAEALKQYEVAIERNADVDALGYSNAADCCLHMLKQSEDAIITLTPDQVKQYVSKMFQYLRCAVDRAPENAEYQFKCGHNLYLYQDISDPNYTDFTPYLKRAYELEKTNQKYIAAYQGFCNVSVLPDDDIVDAASG